jgi:hypothetical protein
MMMVGGFEFHPNNPSPALRERVPRAARRVRAEPQQPVYRGPVTSIDAQPKGPPAPRILDRRRAAHVVSSSRSAPVAIQVSPTASDRSLHCRLCVHRIQAGHRTGRQSACGQCGRRAPNGLARDPGLEDSPVLEQRCSRQYRRRNRSRSRGSRIDPHPPSPAGWAPPSPAVRERGEYWGR